MGQFNPRSPTGVIARLLAAPLLATCLTASLAAQAPPEQLSVDGILPPGKAGTSDEEAPRQEYRVWLLAGQRAVIEASSEAFDTYLRLRRVGDPASVAENDDYGDGLNSRIVHIPAQNAEYIVAVSSYAIEDGGSFHLRVRSLAPRLPSTAGEQPSQTRPWRMFVGELNGDDPQANDAHYDDYELTLTGGTGLVILLDADDEGFDPVVQVFRAGLLADEPLASNDDSDSGLNSVLLFEAPGDGTYVIRATAIDGDGQGPYQLRIGEVIPRLD